MSRLEELLYSAEEHGKREEVIRRVIRLTAENPAIKREDAYERAYQEVMKT